MLSTDVQHNRVAIEGHQAFGSGLCGWLGGGRFALCNSDRIPNAILSMEDRQDLLLAPKVEDLRRKVSELAAIIGRPDAQP